MEMLYGRFINDVDIKQSRKVLIVSNKQAKELCPKDYKNLVGQYVKVGNFAYKVVGIYKERENSRADAYSSYSAIKRIYGAKNDDAGRIEFTFHGLESDGENL